MQRILPALALLLALCLPCLASGEITATDATGQTLYAVEYLGAQVMTASTGALAAESDASWSSYAIPLTEIGTTGTYVGSEPTGAAAGKYVVSVYEEATPGTVSLASDTRVGLGSLEWSGTAPVTLVSVNSQAAANLTAIAAAPAATVAALHADTQWQDLYAYVAGPFTFAGGVNTITNPLTGRVLAYHNTYSGSAVTARTVTH